ncbi:MAG: hypothetical protein C0402_13905 [Thermodesulfovibrio sp.]|nr:hypothetical protein [Thermodesulfovibrio sp.]
MKTKRLIAAGLIAGAMLLSMAASGVEAKGRAGAGGGQGQNMRLRDGSCTATPGTQQGNATMQRGSANSTGIRPMDGTGNGFGDGTQPRPMDGTGFGSGNRGR